MDIGCYRIKCLAAGGLQLQQYGQFTFAEGQEIDLLDVALPGTIRAGDYATAQNMCEDETYELAQHISAGDLAIVERRPPDFSALVPQRRA